MHSIMNLIINKQENWVSQDHNFIVQPMKKNDKTNHS